MRGEFGELGSGERPIGFVSFLFLVFYLTRGRIFVNRPGLPAKFCNLQAAMNWPGHTPE